MGRYAEPSVCMYALVSAPAGRMVGRAMRPLNITGGWLVPWVPFYLVEPLVSTRQTTPQVFLSDNVMCPASPRVPSFRN